MPSATTTFYWRAISKIGTPTKRPTPPLSQVGAAFSLPDPEVELG